MTTNLVDSQLLLGSGEPVMFRLNWKRPTGDFLSHLRFALLQAKSDGQKEFFYTHDFGIPVGINPVVEALPHDTRVFYAIRAGHRRRFSRIVRRPLASRTQYLTVILKRIAETEYLLLTAYYGPKRPREVDDHGGDPESREYWSRHGFASQFVELTDTYRSNCPWGSPLEKTA